MNDIIINNNGSGNGIVINRFKSPVAEKIYNTKSFLKCFRLFGQWRVYLTNTRLKRRGHRDLIAGVIKVPRYEIWKNAHCRCQKCGAPLPLDKCEIHHSLPLSRFKALAADKTNLLCLCHECHKEIHCNPFIMASQIAAECKKRGYNVRDYYAITEESHE